MLLCLNIERLVQRDNYMKNEKNPASEIRAQEKKRLSPRKNVFFTLPPDETYDESNLETSQKKLRKYKIRYTRSKVRFNYLQQPEGWDDTSLSLATTLIKQQRGPLEILPQNIDPIVFNKTMTKLRPKLNNKKNGIALTVEDWEKEKLKKLFRLINANRNKNMKVQIKHLSNDITVTNALVDLIKHIRPSSLRFPYFENAAFPYFWTGEFPYTNNGLEAKNFQSLLEALRRNTSLETLDLSVRQLNVHELALLTRFLPNLARLQKIKLNFHNLKGAPLVQFFEELSKNHSHLDLDISNNLIGGAAAAALIKSKGKQETVDINLSWCFLNSSDFNSILVALETITNDSAKSIHCLNLSGNLLSDANLNNLLRLFEVSRTKVGVLDVSGNELSAGIFPALQSLLFANTPLQEIDLSKNIRLDNTAPSVQAFTENLAEGLAEFNTNLCYLKFSSKVNIHSPGINKLNVVLERNRQLLLFKRALQALYEVLGDTVQEDVMIKNIKNILCEIKVLVNTISQFIGLPLSSDQVTKAIDLHLENFKKDIAANVTISTETSDVFSFVKEIKSMFPYVINDIDTEENELATRQGMCRF